MRKKEHEIITPCTVYVLELGRIKDTGQAYYVGMSSNPLKRLLAHIMPEGKSDSTTETVKRSGVSRVISVQWYASRAIAREREKHLNMAVQRGVQPLEPPCSMVTIAHMRNFWKHYQYIKPPFLINYHWVNESPLETTTLERSGMG